MSLTSDSTTFARSVPVAAAAGAADPAGRLAALLERVSGLIAQGDVRHAFALLGEPLSVLRDEALAAGCVDTLQAMVREHPLYAAVLEDPYTRRARTKPRGYAGDAVMLDHVYDAAPPPGETMTPLGQQVFRSTTRGPMGLSVLFRRALLQAHINDTVARVPGARILSIASGHCRELAGSLVEGDDFEGSFTAFDQDAESCAEVRRNHPDERVKVVCASVRALLAGRHPELTGFDFIYSAGLYDYLAEPLARQLTQVLAGRLAPQGRLLIANFVRQGQGRGYMEWFMDWELLLRTEAELRDILQTAGAGQVSSFVDPHANVAYATYTAA